VPNLVHAPATAILVALVAVGTVVDIAVHALVVLIGLGFLMAVCALEHRVIVGIGVARGTNAVGTAVIGRPPGVVEGRTRPGGRGVTR